MSKNFLKLFVAVIFLVTGLFVGSAFSQSSYPDKPIKVISWTTSGMGDAVRRASCIEAQKELGQPIVMEYMTGASGTIMMNYLAKAKPDGYTLGTLTTSVLLNGPQMRNTSYDTRTDFVDIVAVAQYTFGLAVKPDAPWKTYEDVIAYARKNPGKFTYTCVGFGTTQHIAMSRIAAKEGIEWTLVPFKSVGQGMTATLGGHVDAIVQGSVDIVPQLKANKLRLLLVLNDERWPAAPDVLTMREKGYDFSAFSLISYIAPKGLPEPIRQKLEDAFKKGIKNPAFVELLNKYQVPASGMGGKEYSELWKSQYDAMGKVIKSLGLGQKK